MANEIPISGIENRQGRAKSSKQAKEVAPVHPLAEKAAEVRAGITLKETDFLDLVSAYRLGAREGKVMYDKEHLPTPDMMKERIRQFQEKGKQGELSNKDQLLESSKLLNNLHDSVATIRDQQYQAYTKLRVASEEIELLDESISAIDYQSILHRGLHIRKRRALAQKRKLLEDQRTAASEEQSLWEERDKQFRNLLNNSGSSYTQELEALRENIIVEEFSHLVIDITESYKSLYSEVASDPKLLQDMKDAFVDRMIMPNVNRQNKYNKFSDETIETCERLWKEYAGISDSQEQSEFVRAHIGDIPGSLLEMFRDYGYSLRDDRFKELFSYLASQEAVAEVGRVAGRARKLNSSANRLNYRLDDQTGYAHRVNLPDRSDYALFSPQQHVDSAIKNSSELSAWQAIGSVASVREVIGEALEAQDRKFYERALEQSLVDTEGRYISALAHYPTPDAIRNLVLIAAADKQSYRTVNVNGVLRKLAERNDWELLLDKAEAQYPQLRNAREILVKWKEMDDTYDNLDEYHSVIRESVKDLTTLILRAGNVEPALKQIAAEATSDADLLRLLKEDGVISLDEGLLLLKAQAVLQETQHEYFDVSESEHVSSYHYNQALRRNLLFQLTDGHDDAPENVRKLTHLAEQIIQHQGNEQSLLYFSSEDVIKTLEEDKLNSSLLFAIPQHASGLLAKGMGETRKFIFEHGDTLLKNISDLRFINTLIGSYGARAADLIREYHACLESGVITTADRGLIAEFVGKFRVLSPNLIRGYKEAKQTGTEEIFFAGLHTIADRLTGTTAMTEAERSNPYYQDLLRHVYQENAGHWSSFGSNAMAEDRLQDLEKYTIQPRYTLDILAASELTIKEGQGLDQEAIERVKETILKLAEKSKQYNFDPQLLQNDVEEQINARFTLLIPDLLKKGLENPENFTAEDKLFVLLSDTVYSQDTKHVDALKDLVISYEFAHFEDIRDYIQGTSDRVSRAKNADYALLCELHTFFSDRIKEVNRRIVEKGFETEAASTIMPTYFNELAASAQVGKQQDTLNRVRIDTLGMSDGFISQVSKVLKGKTGKSYSLERVRETISRYERMTGGLGEKTTESGKTRTKAFYGQLKSQRDRTFAAIQELTGEEIDPKELHLEDVDMDFYVSQEQQLLSGTYDPEQFAAYTAQRFVDIFSDERGIIEGELAKFQSASGKEREVLYGYITKTKESANARMVGGVCVSGDNPKRGRQNMWDMENYFQLVLQEPETYRCQGLVLLHEYNQAGKKILAASFNPSSTYLYSVDEAALLESLMHTLSTFAQENDFDIIGSSPNRTIRTNRTGGGFERALDERIQSVGELVRFQTPGQFSYNPNYIVDSVDVLWKNPSRAS